VAAAAAAASASFRNYDDQLRCPDRTGPPAGRPPTARLTAHNSTAWWLASCDSDTLAPRTVLVIRRTSLRLQSKRHFHENRLI